MNMNTTSRSRFSLLLILAGVLCLTVPVASAQGLMDSLKKGNSATPANTPVNPDKGITLVLVPWPCPSMEYYKMAEINIDAFLALMVLNDADPSDFEAIIVQAPYASEDNVSYINSDEWWGPSIKQARERYSFYEELGFLRYIDTLSPAFKTSIGFEFTPSYFIFSSGELTSSGNIMDLIKEFSTNY